MKPRDQFEKEYPETLDPKLHEDLIYRTARVCAILGYTACKENLTLEETLDRFEKSWNTKYTAPNPPDPNT